MAKVAASSKKRKRPIKKTPSPDKLRKLTKAELRKIGLSAKSERYVRSTLKRLRKDSATFSKRSYLTAQRGGAISLERYAKSRRATVRTLKSGSGEPYEQHRYRMPANQAGFDKRVREIQRKHGVKPISAEDIEERAESGKYYEFGSSPTAHVIFEYANGHALTGRLTFLNEVSWETNVADATTENRSIPGSGHMLPIADLKGLWLSVSLR